MAEYNSALATIFENYKLNVSPSRMRFPDLTHYYHYVSPQPIIIMLAPNRLQNKKIKKLMLAPNQMQNKKIKKQLFFLYLFVLYFL